MKFRATDFEFRNRFWLIGGIFWLAFLCYAFDKVNATDGLSRWMLGQASGDSPALDRLEREILWAGAALAVLAALVRSWAEAYLNSEVVHDASIHSERLVADGPYRRVRNPLYFGNVLLALGMGLLASRTGFAILVIGMTAFCYRLIFREEAGLLETQGEGFRRYLQSVPRMFPSPWPRVAAGGGVPNWLDGFGGESFIWGFAVGMVLFAITLSQTDLWIAVALGFAVYFLQYLTRKKRSD